MKDRWTSMAIGGALLCLVVSMVMDGGNPAVLFKPSPMLLVFGGTFFAGTAGYMKSDVKSIRPILKQATRANPSDVQLAIEEMVRLASLAKGSGILALDKEADNLEDPFLRRGVQLAVDGNNSEDIRQILESDIMAVQDRHRMGAKVFADMGGFAPTLGILGTVIGLINVLAHLNSPGSLGPAIGSAFTATLWGVLTANLVWLPISNKLKRASELEVRVKMMELEGLLAIQAGATSRVVRMRMESFLPASSRGEAVEEKKVAA